jgi:hypothetical protein
MTDTGRRQTTDTDKRQFNLFFHRKHKKGVGKPRKISIAELHMHVRAVPFHFRKNVGTLSFKIGIP